MWIEEFELLDGSYSVSIFKINLNIFKKHKKRLIILHEEYT